MPRPRSNKVITLKDGQRVRVKLVTETTHLGTRQRSAEDIILCCECNLGHRFRFTVKGDVLTWRAYRLEGE